MATAKSDSARMPKRSGSPRIRKAVTRSTPPLPRTTTPPVRKSKKLNIPERIVRVIDKQRGYLFGAHCILICFVLAWDNIDKRAKIEPQFMAETLIALIWNVINNLDSFTLKKLAQRKEDDDDEGDSA